MGLIGVIGGTGLDQWGGLEREFSGETPYGSTSAPIATYEVGESQLLFIARHGHQHSIPPHKVNYRANLYALHQAGVEQVVAVNAVGAITERYEPGMLAAITASISRCGGNIVEIYHQRLFYDVPAKLAKIDAVIETRGPDHVTEIIEDLRQAQFQVHQLDENSAG